MWILFWTLGWPLLGAAVLAALDTEDEVFFKWYQEAPAWWLKGAVLYGWPLMVGPMVKYRRREK